MRFVQDLTPQDRWGIGGTDLGVPFRLPSGEFGWLFGDTFRNHGVGGPGWRSPVMLRSSAPRGSEPVQFTSAARGGEQILDYIHEPDRAISTVIPADAITIDGVAYMASTVMWHRFGNVLQVDIHRANDPDGENWSHTAKIPGGDRGGMMQQMSFDLDDHGIVHILTSSFGRNRDVLYFTVPGEHFTDINRWVQQPHSGITRSIGEFGLRYIGGRWYLGYFDAANYRCVLRVADTVQGLSDPGHEIVTAYGTDWRNNRVHDARVAQLYAGYPFGVEGDVGVVISHWNVNYSGPIPGGHVNAGWPYRSMQFHVNELSGEDTAVWDLVRKELTGD